MFIFVTKQLRLFATHGKVLYLTDNDRLRLIDNDRLMNCSKRKYTRVFFNDFKEWRCFDGCSGNLRNKMILICSKNNILQTTVTWNKSFREYSVLYYISEWYYSLQRQIYFTVLIGWSNLTIFCIISFQTLNDPIFWIALNVNMLNVLDKCDSFTTQIESGQLIWR